MINLLRLAYKIIYQPLPDFITSARRLLMLSAVFFAFLVVGAIFASAPADVWVRLLCEKNGTDQLTTAQISVDFSETR